MISISLSAVQPLVKSLAWKDISLKSGRNARLQRLCIVLHSSSSVKVYIWSRSSTHYSRDRQSRTFWSVQSQFSAQSSTIRFFNCSRTMFSIMLILLIALSDLHLSETQLCCTDNGVTCESESLSNNFIEFILHNSDCDVNFSKKRFNLFSYDICQSKQISNQQKDLSWLTLSFKEKYDSTYTTFHARWNRIVNYVGTCLLISKDWRSTDSLNLITLFNSKNIFIASSFRALFSYEDYQTFFVRIKVWYTKWSRTNFDLNNLLSCEFYKSMNASHLCHHEHCVIYIVYESADINEFRKTCLKKTRFLRSEKQFVFVECDLHDSSCIMQMSFFVAVSLIFANNNQHAAFISFESYRHQFQILVEVNDLSSLKLLPRSRRYSYSTFEFLLLLQYLAVVINRNELIFESFSSAKKNRSNLICDFCSFIRLKFYANIVKLWAHMIHEH